MINLEQVAPNHLWYVVGYIAADGCLSKDGRHIDITSKDIQILRDILDALHLNITIGKKNRDKKTCCNHVQISDRNFYKFLLKINLTPKKSLTLKQLLIPNKYFPDFLRGVIDGDGSINTWIHKSNGHRQWALKIVSASYTFANWIKEETEKKFSVAGKLHIYPESRGRNELYVLKFGKIAAKIILKKYYYKDCLVLKRKLDLANKCLEAESGWSKYKKMNARVV